MQLQQQKVLVPNIFQVEALGKLDIFELTNSRGVVIMPTGTGKTFLAALWFRKKLDNNPNAKLLFICHNNDILSQANEKEFQNTLKDLDISYGYYNQWEKNVLSTVTFATTQTLARNMNKFKAEDFDYVIVDEVHHYQANTFKKVVLFFKPRFMLGLTATPDRMDNKNIYSIMGQSVYNAHISDAIKKDLLTKINYYCVDNDIDFSDVRWNGSNYSEKDLNKKICIKEYDDAIIKEYKETLITKFNKKKTICFCATVEHVHRLTSLFNKNGFKSIGLTGRHRIKEDKVSRTKRKEIIDGFRNNKYNIIFVRDLFNEGVDIPDADSIMMLRPTQSHTIFTQQIGRGLRKSEGKNDVLILDFTGNARRCIINFEVLSNLIGEDIIENVKNRIRDCYEKKEIIIFSNGCQIRLNKVKINILRERKAIPSQSELVNEYWYLKDKLGRQPSAREVNNCAMYHRMYWGSWQKFLISIGEKYKLYTDDVSKKDLVKEYFDVKRRLGRQPIQSDFSKNKQNGIRYSLKKIENEYGHWTDFLKAMNEPLNQNNVFADDVTDKELIDNYYHVKNIKGGIITSQDISIKKGISKYGISKYQSKFGSWTSFLDKIREPCRKLNILYADIKEDLIRVRDELKHIPNSEEYIKKGKYSIPCVRKIGNSWGEIIKKVFGENCDFAFSGSRKEKRICPVCKEEYTTNLCQPLATCSNKCKGIYATIKKIGNNGQRIIDEYNKGKDASSLAKELGVTRNCVARWLENNGIKMRGRSEARQLLKKYNNKLSIITEYKPINKLPKIKKIFVVGKGRKNNGWTGYKYKTSTEKIDIRSKIIGHIQDGDKVLLLESPELSAIKEIEKLGKRPAKIVIPNNKEFKELVEALKGYTTNLNIEVINTSVLQYMIDTTDSFNFVWLDYCGAFTSYMKDLDTLFGKKFSDLKLILTYNLFDPNKEDDSYYFTKVIDYVLSKIADNSKVRLMPEVSYRYKKTMYNIGFDIQAKMEA